MRITVFIILFLIIHLQSEAQRLIMNIGVGPTYSTFMMSTFGQYANAEPNVSNFYYKPFLQGYLLTGYRINPKFSLMLGVKWNRKGTSKGTTNGLTGEYYDNAPWVDVIGYPIKLVYKPLISRPFFLSLGIIPGRMYTESSQYSNVRSSYISYGINEIIFSEGYFNELSSDVAIGYQIGKRFEIQLNWNQSLIPIARIQALGTIAVPNPGLWPNEITIYNTNFGLSLSFNLIKNKYGK